MNEWKINSNKRVEKIQIRNLSMANLVFNRHLLGGHDIKKNVLTSMTKQLNKSLLAHY